MEKLYVFDTDQEFTAPGWEQDAEASVIAEMSVGDAIELLFHPDRKGEVL